jgi:predicted DCC family thiol-disulfide oxidoreductase YuxK
VLVIPNQRKGALRKYGVSRAEAERAAWAVDRLGRRWEGAAAINRVLAELDGPWPRLAAIYRFAPAAEVEETLYRWFARNRARFRRFGVTPECEEPGSGCA